MKDNFNMDSRLWSIPASFHNGRIVSFQSAAVNSAADVISGDISNGLACMFMSSNPDMIDNMVAPALARSASGTVLHEPITRLPYVSGSPTNWSPQEIETLFEGLFRYANEPSIQKFTKIASMLPKKTIRDVAIRCQTMSNRGSGRRRKSEGYTTKRVKDTKRTVISSVSENNQMTSSENTSLNTATAPGNLCNDFPSGDLEEAQHLLGQNVALFGQIEANLTGNKNMLQRQDNVDLFLNIEKNIRATQDRLNRLSNIMIKCSGEVSKLPPMPESVNEKLLEHLISLNGIEMKAVVHAAQGSSSFPPSSGYFRPTG